MVVPATKHNSVGQASTPWLPEDQGMAGTVSQGEVNTLEWLKGRGILGPETNLIQQCLTIESEVES